MEELDIQKVCDDCCDDYAVTVNNQLIGKIFQWLIDNDYKICISGSYNAYVEKELSEEEYVLIKELCDVLDTGYEALRIYDGWGHGIRLGI